MELAGLCLTLLSDEVDEKQIRIGILEAERTNLLHEMQSLRRSLGLIQVDALSCR